MPQEVWDFVNYEQPSDGKYYFPEGTLLIVNGYVAKWTRREDEEKEKSTQS